MCIDRVKSCFLSWILLFIHIFDCIFADIQEFYECTLLDDSKDVSQKTLETLQMVNRWEKDQPIITSTLKHEVCTARVTTNSQPNSKNVKQRTLWYKKLNHVYSLAGFW